MKEMELLYRQYESIVYQHIYARCKDRLLAEEITQETFYQIISRCCVESRFRGERFFRKRAPVESQVCQLADLLLKRELLRKEREQPAEPGYFRASDISDIEYLPEVYAVQQAELKEVREKVEKLEESVRSVIFLRYYKNMTYKQVAAYLHQSENWVKHLLRRGKDCLEQMLG